MGCRRRAKGEREEKKNMLNYIQWMALVRFVIISLGFWVGRLLLRLWVVLLVHTMYSDTPGSRGITEYHSSDSRMPCYVEWVSYTVSIRYMQAVLYSAGGG